ncbi:MAG TPA: FAD-binding domain-containing protein, partial [Paracoccaceae bacterium]
QAGGRAQGLVLLESFLQVRGLGYRSAAAAPLAAERASSRLSAHLAQGTLSGREVALACALRRAERPGGGWGSSLRGFQSRLEWRDRLLAVSGDAGQPEGGNVLDAGPRHEPDAARLAAWAAGETGLPFLDACMRYLAATGWLPFRLRAMAAAAACGPLGLDWRASGAVLARRFTDYEPGIHWAQMRSCSAGAQGFRPGNPVKLGLALDPTGAFTRRWVPELAAVPDTLLQVPWKWPGAQGLLGRRYPEPLVDPASAVRGVSRAAPGGAGTAQATRRRRAVAAGQLSLNL